MVARESLRATRKRVKRHVSSDDDYEDPSEYKEDAHRAAQRRSSAGGCHRNTKHRLRVRDDCFDKLGILQAVIGAKARVELVYRYVDTEYSKLTPAQIRLARSKIAGDAKGEEGQEEFDDVVVPKIKTSSAGRGQLFQPREPTAAPAHTPQSLDDALPLMTGRSSEGDFSWTSDVMTNMPFPSGAPVSVGSAIAPIKDSGSFCVADPLTAFSSAPDTATASLTFDPLAADPGTLSFEPASATPQQLAPRSHAAAMQGPFAQLSFVPQPHTLDDFLLVNNAAYASVAPPGGLLPLNSLERVNSPLLASLTQLVADPAPAGHDATHLSPGPIPRHSGSRLAMLDAVHSRPPPFALAHQLSMLPRPMCGGLPAVASTGVLPDPMTGGAPPGVAAHGAPMHMLRRCSYPGMAPHFLSHREAPAVGLEAAQPLQCLPRAFVVQQPMDARPAWN